MNIGIGIAMLKPVDVHTGKATEVLHKRQEILDEAFVRYSGRFSKGKPKVPSLAKAVYINKPKDEKHVDEKEGSLAKV